MTVVRISKEFVVLSDGSNNEEFPSRYSELCVPEKRLWVIRASMWVLMLVALSRGVFAAALFLAPLRFSNEGKCVYYDQDTFSTLSTARKFVVPTRYVQAGLAIVAFAVTFGVSGRAFGFFLLRWCLNMVFFVLSVLGYVAAGVVNVIQTKDYIDYDYVDTAGSIAAIASMYLVIIPLADFATLMVRMNRVLLRILFSVMLLLSLFDRAQTGLVAVGCTEHRDTGKQTIISWALQTTATFVVVEATRFCWRKIRNPRIPAYSFNRSIHLRDETAENEMPLLSMD